MRWPYMTTMVGGYSMLPALHPGDYLLVRRGTRVRAGHVVLVRHPQRPTLLTIKRAVRRGGDGWWVEGDNPDASDDSRTYGPVDDGAIVGRVVLRYWPLHGWTGWRVASR
ncbi:MAG: nickel-type superoxide dismutase maturation protease [Streptosporangiales bacterium]|nr:nickel-type superoxide dismutase maturation protease [Streptosporangiales bacterium]